MYLSHLQKPRCQTLCGVRQPHRSRRNGGIFNKSRRGIRACESDGSPLPLSWSAHLQAGFEEDVKRLSVCPSVCLGGETWQRTLRVRRTCNFQKRGKRKKGSTFNFLDLSVFCFFFSFLVHNCSSN